jgi:hypothetical protein
MNEEELIRGKPSRFGLKNHPEESVPDLPEELLQPDFKAFLSNLIGTNAIISEEVDVLEGAEAGFGVAKKVRGNGQEVLVHDKQTVTRNEIALLEHFTALFVTQTDGEVIDNYKERVMGTRFEWNFRRNDDAFIKSMVELAKSRLESLRQGDTSDRYLKSQGLTNTDDLYNAANYFREMAKQRGMKDAMKKQYEAIPIKAFQGKTKGGQVVEIDKSEVDYILRKNDQGETELLIFCKNQDKYTQIRPVYYPDNEAQNANLFHRVEGTGEEITVQRGKNKADDLSNYEFHIDEGTALVQPLFGTVRVYATPRNLQQDLKDYEEEQDDYRDQIQQRTGPTPGSRRYTPQAPSVPSTHNWATPTTYVSSG